MFPEVTTVIAGAKNPQQAADNAQTSDFPLLDEATMRKVQAIYDASVRQQVQGRR
jgi:aryl-alcohol dehydrogenase-like predicted oxidoreductase